MASHSRTLDNWFERLATELFQTERSAMAHPLKEAERLTGTPPAQPMLQISAHAEASLRTLSTLLPEHVSGESLGEAFSLLREWGGDRALTLEMSYRGTMLGVTHGLDLVRLFRPIAARHGHDTLSQFLDRWLEERSLLLEACRREVRWFVDHPEVACDKP